MNDYDNMGKMYATLLLEEAGYVVGFHGSYGNKTFDNKNERGIWFAEDVNSDIIEYYSNRGDGRTVIEAKLKLGKNLDLSMYNADEMMNSSYADSFLNDMEIEDEDVSRFMDYFFFEDYETNQDEYGEPTLSASEILNHVINLLLIPNKLYDSVSILEGDDHMTYCMLNEQNIEMI